MEGIILSERNSTRSGCKDVFHAFLVKNATYDGDLETGLQHLVIYKSPLKPCK